jgi:hypothetical protein
MTVIDMSIVGPVNLTSSMFESSGTMEQEWMSKEDKSVDRGAGRLGPRVVGNDCKCDTTIFLLTAALS